MAIENVRIPSGTSTIGGLLALPSRARAVSRRHHDSDDPSLG